MWIAAFSCARSDVVHERVHSGRDDIGVPRRIEPRIEERVRVSAFSGPGRYIVRERLDPCLSDVRVVGQIERRVEQRVRCSPFPPAVPQVVTECTGDAAHIRVA